MHHPIVTENTQVCLYYGEELARYGLGQDHPFGPDRLDALGRKSSAKAWTSVVSAFLEAS